MHPPVKLWLAVSALCMVQSTVWGRDTGDKVALLVIDVQDCFMPWGSLPLADGDKVIPVINKIREDLKDDLSLVVLSQDWHCPDHISFASQHNDGSHFSQTHLSYDADGRLCHKESFKKGFQHARQCDSHDDVSRVVPQTLWPDHCVQHVTSGPTSAEFTDSLVVEDTDVVVRKGFRCHIDSYSAFFDNGGFTQTELDNVLQENGIGTVIVTGVALDVCVFYSSKDALKLGYNVILVRDACKGTGPEAVANALKEMEELGIVVVDSENLKSALESMKQRSKAAHTDL